MVGLFLCLEQFCLKNVGHCRVLCICVGGDKRPPLLPPIGRERIGIDTLVLILILHHFIRSTHKSRYPLIYQRRLWPQFPTVNNNFTLSTQPHHWSVNTVSVLIEVVRKVLLGNKAIPIVENRYVVENMVASSLWTYVRSWFNMR